MNKSIQEKRTICLVSESKDLEIIRIIEDFPALMSCTDQNINQDFTSKLIFSISKKSGFIQLQEILSQDILYSPKNRYHGSGSVGNLWKRHHLEFANFIKKTSPKKIFEIGGGHGLLAHAYQESFGEIDWTILEPSPRPIDNVNAEFIEGYFDENFLIDKSVNTIIHSHTFEHIYNPNDFLRHLNKTMRIGASMIFSIPNMNAMLDKKYPNFMNFEHTTFLSENYVDHLLSKNNFQIIEKSNFEEHSIFYHVKNQTECKLIKINKNSFKINRSRLQAYFDFFDSKVKFVNEKITNRDGKIYLFGAHIFAQLLIKIGLNSTKINFLLDNDKSKHNKRLYGTNLKVLDPIILKNESKPLVILNAGIYNNEIKNQIINSINSNTEFVIIENNP